MSKLIKTLKRWHRNIDWLLNHPPIGLTYEPNAMLCDYCHGWSGEVGGIW